MLPTKRREDKAEKSGEVFASVPPPSPSFSQHQTWQTESTVLSLWASRENVSDTDMSFPLFSWELRLPENKTCCSWGETDTGEYGTERRVALGVGFA